jgi:Phage tail tube protein
MASPGSVVIRGEQWKMSWAPEITYGTDPGSSAFTRVFGVVQNATMPDPNINWASFWGMSNSSNRNWSITYPGPISLTGSIGDIILLDGRALMYAIGNSVDSGGPTYVHTISEAVTLPSFALHLTEYGSDGSVQLMRRYLGGKVNRASIKASEGDYLKYSLDEIDFIGLEHNISSPSNLPFYSAGVTDPSGLVYPSTQPYLFSYGTMSLDGTTFARLRNFNLSISNSLDAKYYVQSASGSLLPYEYREGQRQYQLSCQIDINDTSLYRELVQMGTYSSTYKGFQVVIGFTRGTGDSITLSLPSTTPGAGLDSMGCLIQTAPHNVSTDPVVSVSMTIIGRNLGIVVNDAISTYP